MPRVYRVMKQSRDDALPEVGDSLDKLGIRERDLQPDESGIALPRRGGVSVVSGVGGLRRRLYKSLIAPDMVPQGLHGRGWFPGAIGRKKNRLRLYKTGDGPFAEGLLTDRLLVVPDEEDHATVQPFVAMPYDDYRAAIVATRADWINGEDDPDE